jgi:transcription antitermination protein NusB
VTPVPTRRQARRQALDVLYQADVTGEDAIQAVQHWHDAGRTIAPFATDLVRGVAEHQGELDAAIGDAAEEWSVERLTAVDRTILRIAVFELRYRHDVPPAAAIDEAVEAAKELSTEDSSRFVNGVLGAIARGLEGTAGAGR